MLYENLMRILQERNIPVAHIERKAKLANGTIGKWAVSDPKIGNVKKVAAALGVSLDDLMKG